jgi:hypothetical protein
VKISEPKLRQLVVELIKEEIRKVDGGFKVYPKKPKKGDKVRKALSKKPMTYQKALNQLQAVERSKALREALEYNKYTTEEIASAIDRALAILNIKNRALKTLMLRIARTESGGNPAGEGEITHHTLNPFQLDPPSVEEVKTNINMRKWRAFINDKKGPSPAKMGPIENQEYNDVTKNKVLSALFATLYVIWALGADGDRAAWDPEKSFIVPASLKDQAAFWKRRYNTESGAGSIKDFMEKNL